MALDRTWYDTLVDDDGTNTVGSQWDKADVDALMDAIDVALALIASVVQTTTSTGTVNDFALTTSCTLLRCNNATLLTLTGLTAGTDGQRLEMVSIGAGQVDLSNQAAGSTAGNRVINGVTGTISLAAGVGRVRLVYDGTTARWRVLEHEQGTWIAVPFTAGDFTVGSGTWTVASGDLLLFRYWLKGRTLTVTLRVLTSSLSAVNFTLDTKIPASLTAAADAKGAAGPVKDNTSTVSETGHFEVVAGGTVIKYRRQNTNNTWSVSTDLTYLETTVAFEVQ